MYEECNLPEAVWDGGRKKEEAQQRGTEWDEMGSEASELERVRRKDTEGF